MRRQRPALVSEALFDEPFWLLAPATHALAAGRRVRETDLVGHRILLLTEGHCLRDQALAICGAGRSARDDDFRATSLETISHMVAAGLGSTLLPALAAPRLASLAKVVARPFRTPAPHRRIGLVWRASFPDGDSLHRLGAFIREHVPTGVIRCRADRASD